MTTLDFDRLLHAVSPGGPSCLSSTTELEPAGGAHTTIAPARYTGKDSRGNDVASYAYEQRFLDGTLRHSVLVDSKQSQLNRVELTLQNAVDTGDSLGPAASCQGDLRRGEIHRSHPAAPRVRRAPARRVRRWSASDGAPALPRGPRRHAAERPAAAGGEPGHAGVRGVGRQPEVTAGSLAQRSRRGDRRLRRWLR